MQQELQTFCVDLNTILSTSQCLVVSYDKDLTNFIKKQEFSIKISSKDSCATLKLKGNTTVLEQPFFNNVYRVLSQLLLNKDITVLSWDIKPLLAYLCFHSKGKATLKYPLCNFLDLKLLCEYLKIDIKHPPSNFLEYYALYEYFKDLKDVCRIHRAIYAPAAVQVIPSIETTRICNSFLNTSSYSYYQLEGQINGRLSCVTPIKDFDDDNYKKFYVNPHSIAHDKRHYLYSSSKDHKWFCFDYCHHEASILQWVSQDEQLNKIGQRGDIYEEIFKTIFRQSVCLRENRDAIKSIFLPIVYGQGINSLSQSKGYTKQEAEFFYSSIQENFPGVFKWRDYLYSEAISRPLVNYFNRPRKFTSDDIHKVANFYIQSTAATVCLHKLVKLFNKHPGIKIVFFVHDCYVIELPENVEQSYLKDIADDLTSEETLYPGLKLKIKVSNWV